MEQGAVVVAAVDVLEEVLHADRRLGRIEFYLDLAEAGGDQDVRLGGRRGGQQGTGEEQGAGGDQEPFCLLYTSVRGLFSGSSKHRYLAIEESIVYELPASCFHQLCGENPGFARFFQADLAAKRQLAQRDGQNLAEFILTRIAREHLLPALEVEASLSLGDAARLQLSHGADALLVRLERDGPEPVSYTHLDVYKRQVNILPL